MGVLWSMPPRFDGDALGNEDRSPRSPLIRRTRPGGQRTANPTDTGRQAKRDGRRFADLFTPTINRRSSQAWTLRTSTSFTWRLHR